MLKREGIPTLSLKRKESLLQLFIVFFCEENTLMSHAVLNCYIKACKILNTVVARYVNG